ncbi:E3 ubiquitin-protein ligase UBR4 isoform X2 [Cimex lectularius]|uniref:UBR-type domain-containing protein n=1 Tax=Cimex lectularius TaxID=79782 RepID=A0A8I6TK15_CIMLE|nr:E3 ubiquitin-protein ligase UBR4 isoform X2 [Cimex lectularius]
MVGNTGVEWGSIVKPVLAASYGSVNKHDITELAKAIIRSEPELLDHEEKYETFYAALTALAADYISSNVSAISKGQIGTVCLACKVLLRYILMNLKKQGESEEASALSSTFPASSSGQTSAINNLPVKQLLLPIKAMCTATSTLSRTDQVGLVSIMKNAKLPPHIKTSLNFPASDDKSAEEKNEKDVKARARIDLSNQIMEQLTSPLLDGSVSKKSGGNESEPKSAEASPDKPNELEVLFVQRNIANLQAIGAADVFVDTCLQMPHLVRYIHKYQTAVSKKGFSLPSTVNEAQLIRHSLQAVASDLSVVWSVLSLPVLEPLTQPRLEKLTTIVMTGLYTALSAATAASILGVSSAVSPKTAPLAQTVSGNKSNEEENNADVLSTAIVEKALEIFNHISSVIKTSTRAGGNVVQNLTLMGAWLLVSGLQGQLTASSQVPSDKPGKDDKGKSPSKSRDGTSRINLMKVQQGFGVLSVALASHALRLIGSLLEDVQFESASSRTWSDLAELSISSQSTALQRALTVLNAVPLNQSLFYLATVSYRKACTLKRIQKHPPEGDNFSTSDSTTYYDEDDMSCSDESSPDVDDDSEPLLGLWFEETISVPDCDNSSNTQSQDTPDTLPKNGHEPSSIVPEKGEPNGFIALATQIFYTMNRYMVTSEAEYMTRYVESGLTEQQMIMLAAIIRDLDRETARTDTGTISVYFGPTLGQLYTEFSQALTRYTHNLLARGLLSASLQSTLLLHLGVSPVSSTDSTNWPLQVYPRTLAVLAQVLLLKQQSEKEAACISIWHRLINTLVDNICTNPTTTVDVENEDLNVEHAQLVLFLFHSLNLMQKKSVLLMCANGVTQVAEKVRGVMRESQILHLARLLLLLDYLVKHLYDAPSTLLEQVQWNLLNNTNVIKEAGDVEGSVNVASRLYCPWNEIEDNYRKLMPQEEFSMRPKFYSLTYGTVNTQELPKLDGLACNFILGSPDKGVKYPVLLDSLIDILSITDQCTPAIRCSEKISYTALCAVQYCFLICWRLLLQLPPSTPYLEKLAQGFKLENDWPVVLHSLIWGPRTAHKLFIPWMTDCLVKQGMYTPYAESVLKNIADIVGSVRYDINLAKNCITALMPSIELSGPLVPKRDLPTLMELCLLNSVVAKAQAYADFNSKMSSMENDSLKTIQTIAVVQELMPYALKLAEVVLAITRSSLMYQLSESEGNSYTQGDLLAFRCILSIISTKNNKTQGLAIAMTPLLPPAVSSIQEKWSTIPVKNFPWSEYASNILPGESYVMAVVRAHISMLSSHNTFTINPSLKHLLHCLVTFISDNLLWCTDSCSVIDKVVSVFAPLSIDATADYLHETVAKVLEKPLGEVESDKHQMTIFMIIIGQIYDLIMIYTSSTTPCSEAVNEKIIQECLGWLGLLLEKPIGRQALDKFFDNSSEKSLVKILLSVASPKTSNSTTYGVKIFQFFNQLFTTMEKNPGDEGLERLCDSVLKLAHVEPTQLSNWLHLVILGPGSRGTSSASSNGDSSPVFSLGITTSPSRENKDPSLIFVENISPPTVKELTKSSLFHENQSLLQHLTAYINNKQNSVSEAKENVAVTLLESLIPMATRLLLMCKGSGFPQLMYIMATLAGAGTGKGHIHLFIASTQWISICKDQISEKEFLTSLENGSNKSGSLVDSCCAALRYIADIVYALSPQNPARASSPPWEGELVLPPHSDDLDWMEDLTHDDDDESGGDDSDEDSLCNKLCTFTITQKEFMNQHWYHCHTCKMIDRVGVCSVCARVCHRGHDVTYAKFGNFFCDCGARESGSCQALVKRNPQSVTDGLASQGLNGSAPNTATSGGNSGVGIEHMLTSSLRRRPSSPSVDKSQHQKDVVKQAALSKLLENLSDQLLGLIGKENSIVGPLITLVKSLLPAVEATCQRNSPVGCHSRSQKSLKELHTVDKKFLFSDQIMVPTLGSQEGAFENVRMNYSGEQGQTIRQLMSAHMIRRVAMCCLASPHGKRQHLAVAHEKGKITILQLSTLLKQADSSKRKLTLTRLSSAPIPFTVLTVTSNPWNEDFLAVCGLKDCHVLTFTSGGSVSEHLVLHPQLEIGNFIIRAVWLPGSQTKLALITADFVKIYDLSIDVLSPQYYFLVPTGKIRDVTFVCSEEGNSMLLLMSSTGYIYTQDMNEASSAKHGAFYVTSTLELYHPEFKESNGQVCGGGVSVYYSHTLRLLFFSYAHGKSFIAPLDPSTGTTVFDAFMINLQKGTTAASNSGSATTTGNSNNTTTPATTGASNTTSTTTPTTTTTTNSSSGNKGSSGSSQPQPLCLWSEVPNHPGIVCATLQASNNPVILMIQPDTIYVQEIKVLPPKAKIMDMVVIRHLSTGSDLRTTLLILCEDGSLRIYNANPEMTEFWLSPSVQALNSLPSNKSNKKKKAPKPVKASVDFFEHCIALNDVEFGGSDLLQIYNTAQIKHRLNTTGMYVVSTKSVGFNVEIINNDAAHVITGVRVLLGSQDIQRVPAYIEVGGRSIQTNIARNRWFDFPLTREESLQADKKLTLTFGTSQDPDGIIMVDSIKVYGKTKEAFGWPEENEESQTATQNASQPTASSNSDTESMSSSLSTSVPLLDRMLSGILEVLDGCFSLVNFDAKGSLKTSAISLSTTFLTLPTSPTVQKNTKSLMASLHTSRQAYHNYRDQAVLNYVMSSLNSLRQITDPKDLDTEAFYRLVLMSRSIAIARPFNLVKFSQPLDAESGHLIIQLTDILWKLHSAKPQNMALASVCIPGLTHVEATVFSLIEIIHAYTLAEHSEAMTALAAKIYLELLLCSDHAVCFSAKHAIIRVLRPRVKRRRVYIPSPPHCSTPGVVESEKQGPVSQPSQDSSEAEPNHYDESVEPIVLLDPAGAVASGVSMNMEALLGGVNTGGFPPMLDIPPDADDETMVQIAIALSLQQEHEGSPNLGLNLQAFHNLAGPALQALAGSRVNVRGTHNAGEAGHYSDTTASPGGSDDEGSTAATDGSTLRTSPADQGGSGGSESGGSGVDSITGEHNVSGRSSAYGEQEPLATGTRSETSSLGVPSAFQNQEAEGIEGEGDTELEGATTLHSLRLSILEKLVQHIPQLKQVGGVTAIPFMQVVLMLTSDLDGEEERGKACLENLLNSVLSLLSLNQPDVQDICTRNPCREVQIVVMRLLSVLMSRPKSASKTGNTNFVSQTSANILLQSGVIDYCLLLLKELLPYWKNNTQEEANTNVSGSLLKPHHPSSPPDMSPFFLRQYVKGHATDVFEAYPQLLTEMALRLPYQVQKHTPNPIFFPHTWFYYLCEYMMTQQTPFVRRQVRKLLLFICGNKEKYRQLRDLHSLESHMKSVKQCFEGNVVQPLTYDALVELTEHLKACVEVGTSRTWNWRQFCTKDNSVLPFLVYTSRLVEEPVAQTTLQLLRCALCPTRQSPPPPPSGQENAPSSSKSSNVVRTSKEKVYDSDMEDAQCLTLVRQLNSQIPRELLTKFIRSFLLETNASSMRWQAHALILSIYKNSEPAEQELLLDQMWSLWPQLPSYGRKASQFVDLLGYFCIKSNSSKKKIEECIEKAVNMLRAQNQVLAQHPNASLYTQLAQYVELDGYYLESDPCLVCNNPELPLTNIKLSSIKIDSKFTTTTQIVKLVSSHTISKITLRIADLKRTKMVRTMNIYYNNKSVQAVIELKNKPAMWHKAKKVNLASGQTEVKVEFPLPIVACNLMVEYADFYENLQASSETLQCPRCSSSVPANPGVCANCGENVFQCHKCRAINYDEKDPFLCHACGFCKYAKFDFTITGRVCCVVDPIENDEDRKKTISAINTHLEKADRVYKQLVGNKPTLEMLLSKINDHRADRGIDEIPSQGVTSNSTSTIGSSNIPPSTSMVNRAIQLLAQRYCTDCKTSFEDLSRIIQKVLACRSKLVSYDRSQLEQSGSLSQSTDISQSEPSLDMSSDPVQGKCYGCAFSATEHCLILLRALAHNPKSRQVLCSKGLIQELVQNNLRRGTTQVQEEVRQLICLVTGDNCKATEEICTILMERVSLTLNGHLAASELAIAVRPEMSLLAALVQKEDSCWEQKLRCVMKLFLMSCSEGKSPVVIDSVTLPCLKIIQGIIKPLSPVSKKYKDKSVEDIVNIKVVGSMPIDINSWVNGEERFSFSNWYKRMPVKKSDLITPAKPSSKAEIREKYLTEKYVTRWKEKIYLVESKMDGVAWLRQVLFNPSSILARQVTCNMLECLCTNPKTKREILDLLTTFLGELGSAGESAAEYLTLYQSLLQPSPWKQYLALKGVLLYLAELLTQEINAIHKFEGSILTSDLSQGYALKMLTELIASFLEQPSIKQQYKGRLVGAVLNGYLSLRRLVVQRTRLIDETQDKLLELLEEMTTGTEDETKAFMTICIQTVERCPPQDVRTPVFIFERLCSIIYPEENDVGEFYLTLEKDAQQEDFLQGRMLGNPYSCNEPGLGPLMRDVKNKICQDCELVALLEDDNGMELLVNNKIISLDLPVKEVYKKIWIAEGGEGDSMRVVYRMRGLLGDATEEFVETLQAKSQQEVNNEEVYKMANVMADCKGLKVLLGRLSQIRDTVRSRALLQVTLKLLQLCVKVSRNQEVLCHPDLGAINILLDTFQLCVSDTTQQSAQLIEQILEIMETILSKTASQSPDDFLKFSQTLGGVEHINSLLDCVSNCSSVKSNTAVLEHLAQVLASLTYSNRAKMAALMDHFKPHLWEFDKFDTEHTAEEEQKMELFSILALGIDRSALGNTLKDYILTLGVVDHALKYIRKYAPVTRPTLLHCDSDEWKEFISKPALKYILRFLTGLASHHKPTQDAVSVDCITIIHRLEQVSSDEHVGSLAENLLEALCTNERAAAMIEEVRGSTRAEKKRLAMAMREKQLGALGMRTNDRGQLTVESQTMMQQMEELGEETGLVCVICREGYKFQPNKVLGVYTFTKRCNIEEFENKARKTVGYSTVTHFNVVHIDCHMSAVRLARARDEWESAALQNANTKCNGLLPLWGPQVPESAFASCLARHNTYLQESTGHRDINYTSTVHDLKLLLLRFAQEKSFHDDTGGGGPQSNMHIIPYLMHMALYVINTTRCSAREVKNLTTYLEEPRLESCFETEGPHYWATLSLLVQSPERWACLKLKHLSRLIVTAHVRSLHAPSSASVSSNSSNTNVTSSSAIPQRLTDTEVKPFQVYRSNLIFYALIDAIYKNHFKKVFVTSEDRWVTILADYIRHNDEALLKSSERLMSIYTDELIPCTSIEEFFDVVGLLGEISDPVQFIAETLQAYA